MFVGWIHWFMYIFMQNKEIETQIDYIKYISVGLILLELLFWVHWTSFSYFYVLVKVNLCASLKNSLKFIQFLSFFVHKNCFKLYFKSNFSICKEVCCEPFHKTNLQAIYFQSFNSWCNFFIWSSVFLGCFGCLTVHLTD